MLKYYVKRSRGETFDKVVSPPSDNVWIHGDMVDETDLDQLVDLYQFDRNHAGAACGSWRGLY